MHHYFCHTKLCILNTHCVFYVSYIYKNYFLKQHWPVGLCNDWQHFTWGRICSFTLFRWNLLVWQRKTFLFIPYIKSLSAVIIRTENWEVFIIQNKRLTNESFGIKPALKLGKFLDTIQTWFLRIPLSNFRAAVPQRDTSVPLWSN